MREREWPFAWLSSTRRAVQQAPRPSSGHPGLVVVGGAGYGKTSLARQWLLDEPPGRLFVATAALRTVPFGAFMTLLDGASPGGASEMRAARATLIASGTSTRIAIDDAHLLDPISAAFLHHIVVESLAQVLVTVRSDTAPLDAVRALWKDDLLPRVDLTALSLEETAELCEASLLAPMDTASTTQLHAASGGNPLFLRRLIEAGLERGALRRVGGLWRLDSFPGLNQRLDEFIGAELSALSRPAREAAALVALGEPLNATHLTALAGTDAVEEAETAGVISLHLEHGDATVRMSHPLYGEHVRAHLGELHARRLRGALAQAALAEAGNARDTIRIALLSLSSDRPTPLALLQEAAQRAVALPDLVVGEQLARAAFAQGGGFASAVVLAHALSWQGKGVAADELLSATRPSTPDEQVAWTIPRVANLFWTMNDPGRARTALTAARAQFPPGVDTASVDAMDAAMALHEGQIPRAIQMAGDVLEREHPSPAAVVWAASTLAVGYALGGCAGDVPPLVGRVRELERGFDTGYLGYAVSIGEALAAVLAGPLPSIAGPTSSPTPSIAGILGLREALRTHAHGRAAATQFADSAAILEQSDSTGWSRLARIGEVEALVLRGHGEAARTALAGLSSTSAASIQLVAPLYELARSSVAAQSGEASTAMAIARRAAQLATSRRQLAVATVALHRAFRYGDISAPAALIEVARHCDGPLPAAMAAHAEAFARRDADGLADHSRTFEQLGFDIEALDAAIHAAEEFARQGRHAREFALRRRIDVLDAALARPFTVAVLRHRRPLPLTDREREVARLVGHGLSNRAIAEALSLSVRTVEGHVYHCCLKLGLRNKQALKEAAIDAHA